MIKYAVRLLKNKFYPLDIPDSAAVQHDQLVLVRTERGEEVAKAFIVNSCVAKKWEGKAPESVPLIRSLSKKDLEYYEELQKEENNAFEKCNVLIKQHNLSMQLVEAKYTFDKRKITFYYTAPTRVDFRNLLKDLTNTFKKVRIDLRHIGVRDETAIMEGSGLCGRQFCCCSWLHQFDSINIKLAKDQGMPVNPSKISGTCGRLLCCLNYEYSNYMEAAKGMPPVGSGVLTADGVGRVCSLHFLNGRVAVKLEDGKIKEYCKQEIEMIDDDVNNIEITLPVTTTYMAAVDEEENTVDISQLEDDDTSFTSNI